MKAIIIDAENKEVREVEFSGTLAEMQQAVKGYIELAGTLVNTDMVFVDEEGLYKEYNYGFVLGERTFVGNGIVVGREGDVNVGCKSTVDQITEQVVFAVKK